MKKSILYTSIGVIALAGVFTAFKLTGKTKAPAQMETVTVARADISNVITATGTLEAIETVEVGTQVSGVIKKLYVDYNTEVKKGQILAKLDETPLLATLDQSKASVDNAQAELDYQKANFERIKVLRDKNLIAESDYEVALYNYRKAEASLNNAKSVYDKNMINLEYATIYSPINGIILDRAVDEGQTVAASFNTPTLFTIVQDLTKMQVEASVAEADIGSVRVGQHVEFKVDAYPGMVFDGQVTQIRLQPVETSNVITYTVIVDAPNPDKKLMPGLTANVTFYITEKKNIIVVPSEAIYFNPDEQTLAEYTKSHPEVKIEAPKAEKAAPGMPAPDGGTAAPKQGMNDGISNDGMKTVWLLKDSTLAPRRIRVGDTDELNYELIDGLQEGDVLVSSITLPESGAAPKEGSAQSPFMPQRPGSNRK